MSTDNKTLARVEYRPTEIDTERLGQIMVRSGFFKDLKDEAQAIVKILYGRELGIGAMASVMGIYIVEGKPSLSAQLIAAAIQRSRRFSYRVREWTPSKCRIEFFEDRESIGESSFSMEEAATAGLAGKAVWKSYSKAMLWARAISQGARAFCPEIFSGPIYTPKELGAEMDSEGRLIDVGGRSVDTRTGEVVAEQEPYVPIDAREVEDADLVRTEDDPLWRRWMTVRDKALEFGMPLQELTLPIERSVLTTYGRDVLLHVKQREKEAASA